MDIKKISDTFSVSPQIDPSQMTAIKTAGFQAIICNRPDGEGAGQPDFAEIETAAKAAGLTAAYVPVLPSGPRDENVAAFSAALQAMPGPVLGYCRSGARAAMLWSIHKDSK